MSTTVASFETFENFVLRRLAGLALKLADPGSTNRRSILLSGFLVRIGSNAYLVSAGHALELVEAFLASGGRIIEARLFDRCDSPPPDYVPQPFPRELPPHWHVHERGIDVGVIQIPGLIVESARAAGAHFFGSTDWTAPPADPMALVVAGFPTANQVEIRDSAGILTGIHAKASIEILDAIPPPPYDTPEYPRLYGKLRIAPPFPEIDGYSGGPVFAFRQSESGQLKMWLYGIQSGWWRTHGVLAFTPFEPVGTALRIGDDPTPRELVP